MAKDPKLDGISVSQFSKAFQKFFLGGVKPVRVLPEKRIIEGKLADDDCKDDNKRIKPHFSSWILGISFHPHDMKRCGSKQKGDLTLFVSRGKRMYTFPNLQREIYLAMKNGPASGGKIYWKGYGKGIPPLRTFSNNTLIGRRMKRKGAKGKATLR